MGAISQVIIASTPAVERMLRRPARSRPQAYFLVIALTLLIGVADYASGIRVSLAVFYIVVVGLTVIWLGWRPGVGVAIGSTLMRLVSDSLLLNARRPPLWLCWNALATLLICLILIWVMHSALHLYRQLEQRVSERTRALEAAARQRELLERELLEAGARERTSVGQELHDDIGQHLVGTALAAKVLAQRLGEQRSPESERAQTIVSLIEEGAAKTRQLAHGLLLATIEPGQLGEKLAELAAVASATGTPCRFREDGAPWIANPSVAAQLFRIAQEAVRNALRHGRPGAVDIVLSDDPRGVLLDVSDDGGGLPSAATHGSGMGLRIMSHRATLVGGTLSIASEPGGGTRVTCLLPRERAAP